MYLSVFFVVFVRLNASPLSRERNSSIGITIQKQAIVSCLCVVAVSFSSISFVSIFQDDNAHAFDTDIISVPLLDALSVCVPMKPKLKMKPKWFASEDNERSDDRCWRWHILVRAKSGRHCKEDTIREGERECKMMQSRQLHGAMVQKWQWATAAAAVDFAAVATAVALVVVAVTRQQKKEASTHY